VRDEKELLAEERLETDAIGPDPWIRAISSRPFMIIWL